MARMMKCNREQIEKALNKKRFKWVDEVMKDEVPPDIYGSMHSDNVADRSRACCWLNERGYRVVDAGEGVTQVFRGTALVRQTKFVLELKDPEELLMLAEVADNKNIPPPPWQYQEE